MDQIKIGKFIAKQRKEKKLTQTQLAEQLNITDRAISKWENGKAMPDSSIMLELSNLLGISVNELLEGEKVQQEEYRKVAEENLIKMKQNEENIQKKACILQTIFTTLCLVLSLLTIGIFIVHMGMNYVMPDTYDGALFESLGPLCIILTFLFIATSAILSFQDNYIISMKKEEKGEEKINVRMRNLEEVFKGVCMAFSILLILLLLLYIILSSQGNGEILFAGISRLAILTVFIFWIYTFLAKFNRSYTVYKKE